MSDILPFHFIEDTPGESTAWFIADRQEDREILIDLCRAYRCSTIGLEDGSSPGTTEWVPEMENNWEHVQEGLEPLVDEDGGDNGR